MKRISLVLLLLALYACKSVPPQIAEAPVTEEITEVSIKEEPKETPPPKITSDVFDESKIIFPETYVPKKKVSPPAIKLEPKAVETKIEQVKENENEEEKEYTFNDFIKLQEKIVATKKDEQELQKLAILYLLADRYPEAEEILSGTKLKDELLEINLAYLYNVLGEHKLAEEKLNLITERWHKTEGVCVEKIELCEKVEAFRRYKPYNKANAVKPGAPILIYVEPKGFKLQKEGQNLTLHLKYNWQLYDNMGNEIKIAKWQNAQGIKEDMVTFKDEVKEFYQTFLLPLPQNLAIGRYILKITVEDLNSGKSAFATMELNVTEL